MIIWMTGRVIDHQIREQGLSTDNLSGEIDSINQKIISNQSLPYSLPRPPNPLPPHHLIGVQVIDENLWWTSHLEILQ